MKDTAEETLIENDLTKRDLLNTFTMWFFTTELSNSYDRLQGLAFGNALAKRLKKLYRDDTEGYKESLVRNLQFYNSEGTFGSIIHGITLSMEEEKARGENVPGEMITGIKTGIMGPIAGIGDTLIWGTIRPIILGLACSFALNGSSLGAVIPFLFPLTIFMVGYNMLKLGYNVGKESIMNILQSGMINSIIKATGILGLFMMGALSSTYVKVKTPLSFSVANAEPVVFQDILDQIAPGILPLIAIFSIYFYFTKIGQNYNKVVVGILAISLIASFLGILG